MAYIALFDARESSLIDRWIMMN